MRSLTAIAIAATLLWACAPEPTAPPQPPAGVLITPPAHFATLWRSVEACAGVSGDLSAVSWYAMPGPLTPYHQDDAAGLWWPDGNRVFISDDRLDDHSLVRHEMLHALLQTKDHPATYVDACSGLVTCLGDCHWEAGELPEGPDALSPEIPPADLEVEMTVLPPLPGEGGWTTVILSARNPHPDPVWVSLADRPDVAFECRLDLDHCSTLDLDLDPRIPLRAYGVRRRAFVFSAPPGTYQLTGGFNSHAVAPRTLVVP